MTKTHETIVEKRNYYRTPFLRVVMCFSHGTLIEKRYFYRSAIADQIGYLMATYDKVVIRPPKKHEINNIFLAK